MLGVVFWYTAGKHPPALFRVSPKPLELPENWHRPTRSASGRSHTNPHRRDHPSVQSTVYDIMRWRKRPLILSFQPFVTELALLLSISKTTRSQLTTGGAQQVSHTKRILSVAWLLCFHHNSPCSIATASQHLCAIF